MKTFVSKHLVSISLLVAFAMLIFTMIALSSRSVQVASAQQGGSNYITKMNISKGVTVGTTSVQLLPASSGRTYAVIVNDGANPLYLSMDGTVAVAGTGVRLNATGGSYEINFLNQYVGAINAVADATTSATVSAYQ